MSEQWDKAVEVWEKSSATDDGLDALFGCIEAVRAESQTLRFELNTALLRIKALEESVEDLLHGEAGESDVTVRAEEPEIRVRISHAHTLKDGWRCDSTTTEWTGRGEPDWNKIREHLAFAHVTGQNETVHRNQGDVHVKALAS